MMKKFAIIILMVCHSHIAQAAEKLTVLLNWMPSTTHAPLVVAKQRGFFTEQGLDVTLESPEGPLHTAKLIADKQADIGLINEPRFLERLDKGLPVIRIGTLIDKPLNCVIALESSGIKSLQDLKGKHIAAVSKNKLKNAILEAMLIKQGLEEKDVTITPMQDHYLSALLDHKVDAISGALRNVEVAALEKSGEKIVVFFPEEHGTPTYSEIVFIANKDSAHDPRFAKFLAAVKKAVRYLDEHPEDAWKEFAAAYPDLNNSLNYESWFKTLPFFAENPAEINNQDWNKLASFMHQHHLLSKNDVNAKNSYIG